MCVCVSWGGGGGGDFLTDMEDDFFSADIWTEWDLKFSLALIALATYLFKAS